MDMQELYASLLNLPISPPPRPPPPARKTFITKSVQRYTAHCACTAASG